MEISAQSLEDLCQISTTSKSDDEPESAVGRYNSQASGGRDMPDGSGGAIPNHERLSKKQTNYAELEFGAR